MYNVYICTHTVLNCVLFFSRVILTFLIYIVICLLFVYSGTSGSGKTFTCDRLIIKMFAESSKSEWLQDIRKVRV